MTSACTSTTSRAQETPGTPLILYGHSLGGAIVLEYGSAIGQDGLIRRHRQLAGAPADRASAARS